MTNLYDNYYETANLFGKPFPELIRFFASQSSKGTVLDLGCGQGRDAIPISHLGFLVTGIDKSVVGIEQMNRTAKLHHLAIIGMVGNIFEYEKFAGFDFILLDSMFHFLQKDREKETELIKKILQNCKLGCHVIFCIQDQPQKIAYLNEAIDAKKTMKRVVDEAFKYTFEDPESGHHSVTDYRMIIIKK